MSYTPTEWKTGDVITAEKLNNIEQGIVNATNFVNVNAEENPETHSYTNITLDNNYSQILEMLENNETVAFMLNISVVVNGQEVAKYSVSSSSVSMGTGLITVNFYSMESAGDTVYFLGQFLEIKNTGENNVKFGRCVANA